MLISEIVLLGAMLLNIVFGVSVFLNHPRRTTNQAYFFLTAATELWLFATWSILNASDPAYARIMIKVASAAAAFIPLLCHLIRIAISNEGLGILAILKRGRYFIIAAVLTAALALSDLFLGDVLMPDPDATAFEVIEPIYGPAFPVFVLYLLCMILALFICYARDRSGLSGRQRIEMDFVVLGSAIALLAGTLFSPVTAILTSTSRLIPIFNALSIMLLNSIIAYGIATRSIMGIAAFLRRIFIYILVSAYMILIYFATLHITLYIFDSLEVDIPWLPPLLAALAVAFSMRPARGWSQSFAHRLISSPHDLDPGEMVKGANKILQSITTVDGLLQQFVKYLADKLGTDLVGILLYSDIDNCYYTAASSERYPPIRIEVDSALVEILAKAKRKRILIADDIKRYARTSILQKTLAEMESIGAKAIAGLYSKGNIMGMIVLGERISGGIYDGQFQDSIELLANQMAISLENSKLYTHIRKQNIYTESILENLVNGVIAVDSSQRITVYNSEAERIIGKEFAVIQSEGMNGLPSPLRKLFEQLFKHRHEFRNHEACIRKPGEDDLYLLIGGTIISSADGDVLGALLVFNDQTTVKNLEYQVRRSDRLASAGQLAAGMAHEIKNPLVSIKTYAELLPSRYDEADFRDEYSDIVVEEISRIDNIVNQLLSFSKPIQPNFKPVHMHTNLKQAIKLLDQEFRKNNVAVECDLAADNDLVRADASQLHQVFVNLMLNAITAMKGRKGKLQISTSESGMLDSGNQRGNSRPGPFIRAEIRDSGCGIDEQDLRKIFDPFFTTSASGSGMGLSVAYTIINDHGGEITVSSVPGLGSTFIVTLPLIHRESDL